MVDSTLCYQRVPHGGQRVYGMGRHKLRTTNNCILSMAIWIHRDTVTRSCYSSAAITSCISMIMHGPMSQGSVHNCWKLKMSQFFHGLHTHHMSSIEPVWDALDQRLRQHVLVPADIQQLHTAIEEEWDNIPQATINSLCEGEVSGKWWSHQVLTDFLINPHIFFKVSVTNRCISAFPVMWNP